MLQSVLFRYLVVGKSYVLKADTAMYHAAWNVHVPKWFVDEKQPYKETLKSGTVMLCVSSLIIPDRRGQNRRSGNKKADKVREFVFRDATTGSIWIYYILDAECCKSLPAIFQGDKYDRNEDDVPTVKHPLKGLRYTEE